MNKKKLAIILVSLLAITCIICRIIYVNNIYPSEKITYVTQDTPVKFKNNEMKIVSSKLYDKNSCIHYLDELSIKHDYDNVYYPGVDATSAISNYDYIINYSPYSDYNILVLEIASEEPYNFSDLSRFFNLMPDIHRTPLIYEWYYSSLLDKILCDNKPNSKMWVYAINDTDFENMYFEITTLEYVYRFTLTPDIIQSKE